ncbi:hypothetical protein MY092_000762 [Salmonella enterica]|uniref:hypothetical protein n=1 Tax=Salmonella enterica TaxID=28901 RepID=UPI000B5F4BD1|nr:hypothetical protein [Salmonella enterica]ASD88355.1 hypothetical protein LFZ16_20140 [Salmonella enterica subsp. enterica serovar India str. SA20085604]EJC4643505.1 hypothetical protein [Salmonella enterica]EKQ9927214.1 hypothetical protein [Salmonella enterica subsp. enterica serovar Panama]
MRTLQSGLKLKVREQMNKMTCLWTGLALASSGYAATAAAAVGAYSGESSVNVEFYVGETLLPVQCTSEGMHMTIAQSNQNGSIAAKIKCNNPNLSNVVFAPLLTPNKAAADGGHWRAYRNLNDSNSLMLDVYKADGTIFPATLVDATVTNSPDAYVTLQGGEGADMTMRISEANGHPGASGAYKLELRVGTWAA